MWIRTSCFVCAVLQLVQELHASGPSHLLLPSALPNGAVLSTAGNTLYAVSLTDGSTLWEVPPPCTNHFRRTGHAKKFVHDCAFDGNISIMKAVDNVLFTAFDKGILTAWSLTDGSRLWSSTDKIVMRAKIEAIVPIPGGVLLVCPGHIQVWTLDGELKWAIQASFIQTRRSWVPFMAVFSRSLQFVAAHVSGDEVCAVATTGRKDAAVFVLDMHNGHVKREMDLPKEMQETMVGRGPEYPNFMAVGDHMVGILGEKLLSCPICQAAEGNVHSWDLKMVRIAGKEPNNFFVPWADTPYSFTISNGHFTFVFRIASDGLKPYINNAVSAVGPVLDSSTAAVAMVAHKADFFHMKLLSKENTDAGEHMLTSGYALSDHGDIRHVIAKESGGKWLYLLGAEKSVVATDGVTVLWSVRLKELEPESEVQQDERVIEKMPDDVRAQHRLPEGARGVVKRVHGDHTLDIIWETLEHGQVQTNNVKKDLVRRPTKAEEDEVVEL